MKKTWPIIVISLSLLLFFLTRTPATPSSSASSSDSPYTFYWNEDCPHCHLVLDFFDQTDLDENLQVVKRETTENSVRNEFIKDFLACFPEETQAAVPFLKGPDNLCLLGDTPIIDFFKSQEPSPKPSPNE